MKGNCKLKRPWQPWTDACGPIADWCGLHQRKREVSEKMTSFSRGYHQVIRNDEPHDRYWVASLQGRAQYEYVHSEATHTHTHTLHDIRDERLYRANFLSDSCSNYEPSLPDSHKNIHELWIDATPVHRWWWMMLGHVDMTDGRLVWMSHYGWG